MCTTFNEEKPMQCVCGSDTDSGSATTKIKGKGRYTLDFQTCKGCARVGGEILRLKDKNDIRILSYCVEARNEYAAIENGDVEPAVKPVPAKVSLHLPVADANALTKIQMLQSEGNIQPASWLQPDSNKLMANKRGRHFFIWKGENYHINVLYFNYLYDDGTSDIYVPLLNLKLSNPSLKGVSVLLNVFGDIAKYLEEFLCDSTVSSASTCATNISTPIQVTFAYQSKQPHANQLPPACYESADVSLIIPEIPVEINDDLDAVNHLSTVVQKPKEEIQMQLF
jgi:hypothetical protein